MPPRTPHPNLAAQGTTRSLRNWWRRSAPNGANAGVAATAGGPVADARSAQDAETQAHLNYLQRLREAGL